jgi:DNA-binding CsgD family transcriptional regulator
LFTAARAQAAAAGDLEIELRALYDDAQVGKQVGDLASAGAGFDDGAELAERSGFGWSRFGIFMRRGQLAVRYLTGDWDGCERLLTAVPELVTTLAAAQVVAQGLGVLVARARPAAPVRLRQLAGLAGADPALDRDVAVWEAELASWQGDLDRARSAIRRGLAAADAFSYGNVYAVARCQWRLAEALAAAGDREQATAAARAAYATATRLAAVPLQAALEALARRGRLDLGVGLPPQRTLAGLTPRELEVLGLLVEGRSNRQIAEELFISGKTASVHVTNLLAKLGVHSRLEAAAMARRLGLEQPAGHES